MTAGRPSLLGSYPVTALNMVGAPLPPMPGSPSQWRPSRPVAQYGIDYTFLRQHRGRPVRWRPGMPITVRIAGPCSRGQAGTVAAVVAEVAGLTGMSLGVGEPRPQAAALRAVPEQEIHIRFLAALPRGCPFAPCAGPAGFGGAFPDPGVSHYVSGLAAVTAGPVSPHPRPEAGVLRHEFAHALGLGHAARPSLLMHDHTPTASADYGWGDRHGLSLLGPAPPATTGSAPRPSSGRTNSCAA
jgi:hypothetical protein